MTLREIILLLKAEKNRRAQEAISLDICKHGARSRSINALQNEEQILDNALRAIDESGFKQPSKWVRS